MKAYACSECGSQEPEHICSELAKAELRTARLESELAEANSKVQHLLNHCQDAECSTCAEIVCKHHEPLHFHHDGCPACEYVPSAEQIGKAWLADSSLEHWFPITAEEVAMRRKAMADIVRVMGFGCGGLAGEQIAPAVAKLRARVADLEKQLKQIYDVATGQEQVAFDDTLGMVWTAEYITEQKKVP